MITGRHKIYEYRVKPCCIQRHDGSYGTAFMAEVTGPYVGEWYAVIGRTLPGAISKLANVMRLNDFGRLNPNCERSDAIMGLNRWW